MKKIIIVKKKIKVFKYISIKKKLFFLIDKNIYHYFKNKIEDKLKEEKTEYNTFKIKGEGDKNVKTIKEILKKMILSGERRSSILISIGGGVCGDISGFLSSIFFRGIKHINLPTTIVSQVDSSIGGKNGINFKSKNIIGTFKKPDKIIVSIFFIKRLSKFFYKNGFSEIIKLAIINNKKLFYYLNNKIIKIKSRRYNTIKKIIYTSIFSKIDIIKRDEKETLNERIKLNLGHTFAHAFERYFRYKKSHCEMVWQGIYFSMFYSLYLKYTNIKNVYPIINMLIKYKCLNLSLISKIKFKNIKKSLSTDKKSISKKNITYIIFSEIGKIYPKKIDFFKIKKIYNIFKKKMFII
ncbi:3-dehydroquinate synthase [Candidatus Vidania fulgoroideorum]